MLVSAIDYRRCIVTYRDAKGFEFPVQEDRDLIPYLRVGGSAEDAERELEASLIAEG